MSRVALCFPGQGSQAAGMANGLLDTPLAKELIGVAADEGLELEAALQGDDDGLRPTEIAQPALAFVELVLTSALPALALVGAAGHSLGEYSALAAVGGLDPCAVLRLVIRRGREMAAMRQGTMVAVMGMPAEEVASVCAEVSRSTPVVVLANLNAPGQVVISGSRAAVGEAADHARTGGARRVVELKVSGAFHSPLMHEAATKFSAALQAAPLRRARLPLVCNVDGAAVVEPAELRDHLLRQMESPVGWIDCVAGLRTLGADVLLEVGPGAALTGLARRIDPQLRTAKVATLEDVALLPELVGAPA